MKVGNIAFFGLAGLALLGGIIFLYSNLKYEKALQNGKTLACGYDDVIVVDKNIPINIDIYDETIYFPLNKKKMRLSDCMILTGEDDA